MVLNAVGRKLSCHLHDSITVGGLGPAGSDIAAIPDPCRRAHAMDIKTVRGVIDWVYQINGDFLGYVGKDKR